MTPFHSNDSGRTTSAELADDLHRALHDEAIDVRIAGANAFFGVLENRRSDDANVILGTYRDAAAAISNAKAGEVAAARAGEDDDDDDSPQPVVIEVPPDEVPAPSARKPTPVITPVPVIDDDEPIAADDVPNNLPALPPGKGAAPARPACAPQGNFVKSFFGAIKSIITGDEAEIVEMSEAEGISLGTPSSADGPDESSFADRDRVEEWLRVIRSDKFLPKWQGDVRADLEPLLAAAEARERVAAVLPLAALGADSVAIPEMLRLIEADAKSIARLAEALPWLLAADREKVVESMFARPPAPDDLTTIAGNLAEIRSPQAESGLWKLIVQPGADWSTADAVKQALVQFYSPKHYYQLQQAPIRDKKRAIASATSHAQSGMHSQRLVGLAFLISLEASTAAEIARPLFEDETAPLEDRDDFLQIVLVALSESDVIAFAVKQIASPHLAFRETALANPAEGQDELQALRDGAFHLNANMWHGSSPGISAGGQPIMPEAPSGLAIEPLLPLLESDNPKVAAQAVYLTALLGHSEGLPTLISYWRAKAVGDVDWMRMVYRAITRLDDGAQVPILREIYSRLNNDQSRQYLSEFYWTIRSMTAPGVLPLRKSIRDEAGMDQLR